MKLNAAFYAQLEATAAPLYRAMGTVAQSQAEQPARPPLLQVQSGRAESPAWYMVQAAEFDPEPLTVANLRVRDIYASESIAQALLELLAAEKWLDRRGDAYYLTEEGRKVTAQLLTRGSSLLAQVTIPENVDLERLERFLRRVIDASLECEEPPGNWCLRHSRRRAPSDDESAPIRLLQYFSDFNAFRDDAHMAAWQPKGITGQQWESFSFVVNGQADSAESLYEQLAYRGYSTENFAAALSQLASRGWLSRSNEPFTVTKKGRAIHAEVEDLTDQYFYRPWETALTKAELEETVELLRVMREQWKA